MNAFDSLPVAALAYMLVLVPIALATMWCQFGILPQTRRICLDPLTETALDIWDRLNPMPTVEPLVTIFPAPAEVTGPTVEPVALDSTERPIASMNAPLPTPTRKGFVGVPAARRRVSAKVKPVAVPMPSAAQKTPKPNYSKCTVAQLRELAKGKGVKGYSRMRKSELVDALS